MFYRKTLSAIKIWSDLKKQRLCKLSRENGKNYNMPVTAGGICCERTSNMWRYLLFIRTSKDASGSRTMRSVYLQSRNIFGAYLYDIFMTYCYKYMWHCIKLWYAIWPFMLHHVIMSCDHLCFIMWQTCDHLYFIMWLLTSCDHIMWLFVLHHVIMHTSSSVCVYCLHFLKVCRMFTIKSLPNHLIGWYSYSYPLITCKNPMYATGFDILRTTMIYLVDIYIYSTSYLGQNRKYSLFLPPWQKY